jgi:hypothetical protein
MALFNTLLMQPKPTEDMFFAALRRLITEYALIEAAIHIIARYISALSEEDARIIFSGMRIKGVIERIRDLSKSAPTEFKNEFETCMSQFNLIGEQRDKLVHRAINQIEDVLLVTNSLTAKTKALIATDKFKLDDLRNMQNDCLAIYLRLHYLTSPELRGKDSSAEKFVYSAWRYKPPKQPHRRHRRGPSPAGP